MRSKRVRAPEAASEARHDAAATDHSARTAGNAHASGRGGADARAETPSAARLRSASRVPASLDASRGRFRAATFNGLKGPRPAFKATLDPVTRVAPRVFFFSSLSSHITIAEPSRAPSRARRTKPKPENL